MIDFLPDVDPYHGASYCCIGRSIVDLSLAVFVSLSVDYSVVQRVRLGLCSNNSFPGGRCAPQEFLFDSLVDAFGASRTSPVVPFPIGMDNADFFLFELLFVLNTKRVWRKHKSGCHEILHALAVKRSFSRAFFL